MCADFQIETKRAFVADETPNTLKLQQLTFSTNTTVVVDL